MNSALVTKGPEIRGQVREEQKAEVGTYPTNQETEGTEAIK